MRGVVRFQHRSQNRLRDPGISLLLNILKRTLQTDLRVRRIGFVLIDGLGGPSNEQLHLAITLRMFDKFQRWHVPEVVAGELCPGSLG